MPIMRRYALSILAAGSLALAACYTVPETGRTALNFMPPGQMALMADQQFAQMKQETPVSHNPEYNELVQRVGTRIAKVVDSDIPPEKWEFVVFEDDQVNAFAMPGGKVGVYTGLIKLVDSDDELAAVMGHEIAHVMARHGGERMSQNVLAQGGALALSVYTENSEMDNTTKSLLSTAYGLGATYGVLMPFSRKQESEADHLGLLYAARAGYDPRAAITFWQKMEAQSSGQPPEFLSTHPSHENRIERLQELMPAALEDYRLAKASEGKTVASVR